MRPFLRKVPAGHVGPFLAAWHRQEPAIAYALHFHHEFELTLILKSHGLRHVGDSIESYADGDLLLAAPALPHSYESALDRREDEHEQIVVHFDPRLVLPDVLADPSMQSVAQLFKDAHCGLCFSGGARKQASDLIKKILDLPPLRRLAALLEALHILSEDQSRRTLSQQAFFTREEFLEPIDKACAFLNQNFTQNITLAKAASLAGMSPAAFARAFRRATGRTLVTYLNEMRLRKACRLLLETERGIAEVAAASGFENVGYFNRRFLATYGTRPKEYRRDGPRAKLE